MALADITREGVLQAVAEFDQLGRDAFLAKYGYGPATTYSLVLDGKHYDPKAIVGVAHQFDRPDLGPLKNNELVGGRTGSSPVLERLGFKVDELADGASGRPRPSDAELLDSAADVLRAASRPMHANEIEAAAGMNQTEGRRAYLAMLEDSRRDDGRQFVQVAGGTFDLAELNPDGAAERPDQPTTAADASWLFQANLKAWDLRGALANLPTVQWVARQSRQKIKAGDTVHFWLSGPEGGVLGRGRILTAPADEPENPSDIAFDLEGGFHETEPRVWIAIERALDAPIGEEDATEFSEIVGDESALTPFELLRDKTLRQEVRDILEELDEREAEILTMRFGLDGSKPRTLEEVGRKFKVTRERVRQIQNIALTKLRRVMDKQDRPNAVSRN